MKHPSDIAELRECAVAQQRRAVTDIGLNDAGASRSCSGQHVRRKVTHRDRGRRAEGRRKRKREGWEGGGGRERERETETETDTDLLVACVHGGTV